MSANYQQPAKHEKSAENPILARLDLELGKPHLLDWSSGPTFFWEENKLHFGFRFDCVVKKSSNWLLLICRLILNENWLGLEVIGSKTAGGIKDFRSEVSIWMLEAFRNTNWDNFFNFIMEYWKNVGMRCNVQNECKNLGAQKNNNNSFQWTMHVFLSFLSFIMNMYTHFNLCGIRFELNCCWKQTGWSVSLLQAPGEISSCKLLTLPSAPSCLHWCCRGRDHFARKTSASTPTYVSKSITQYSKYILIQRREGCKIPKKNDRERLYLFIILTVSDWRSSEKV